MGRKCVDEVLNDDSTTAATQPAQQKNTIARVSLRGIHDAVGDQPARPAEKDDGVAAHGHGHFTAQTRTWPAGLAVQAADLDGDGRDDLFGYSPRSGVWFTATFSPRGFSESTGQWTIGWHVATGDLNGDGRTDVVIV